VIELQVRTWKVLYVVRVVYYCLYINTLCSVAMDGRTKSQTLSTDQLLTRLLSEISTVKEKLNSLAEVNSKILKSQEKFTRTLTAKSRPSTDLNFEPDVMSLLSLPLYLRKTAMVLYKLERATADDLARETKRLRAVESAAANQLVRLGYLKKKRDGRDVYFYIESSAEAK
jgi:hypothetical protein